MIRSKPKSLSAGTAGNPATWGKVLLLWSESYFTPCMAYRRTPNVTRRLAARKAAIVEAARAIAGETGLAAVQIAPVAARAGIAAGTVYRYFPSKTELVGAVVEAFADEETAALRQAGDAAPGPLSAIAAAIATLAARLLTRPRLAYAVLAEPVDAVEAVHEVRTGARQKLAEALEARIAFASSGVHLPDQDAALAARAIIGAMIEGLVGPLVPRVRDDAALRREHVQTITLFALRALGVVDARARGLVVQAAIPVAPAPGA